MRSGDPVKLWMDSRFANLDLGNFWACKLMALWYR